MKTKTQRLGATQASIEWNLASIWNDAAMKENYELRPRDYVYASEIGMSMYDRYNKMKAVPYTNPPNNRSLRKFLAGNIWEYVTKQILIATGIYRREEIKIDAQPYAGLLSVHGRCDFISGGLIDKKSAMENVKQLNLPDFLVAVAHKIINATDGLNLRERIIELKSVSTFAMDKVERINKPLQNHQMQGFHYQRNGGYQAAVSYICKDDCRMAQFDIIAEDAEPLYKADLEKITDYFTKGIMPPLEPLASFDFATASFSKNLQVEYSPYLLHYGFENPDQYRDSVKFEKWNRGLNRYALCETGCKTPTGKQMVLSAKNKEVRNEIEVAGYDFDKLLRAKIDIGITNEEE